MPGAPPLPPAVRAQLVVGHPEDLHRATQLLAAVLGEGVALGALEVGEVLGDDLALLAERAGEHVDVVTAGDVVRDGDTGREGLVVGVGVHEEQPRGTAVGLDAVEQVGHWTTAMSGELHDTAVDGVGRQVADVGAGDVERPALGEADVGAALQQRPVDLGPGLLPRGAVGDRLDLGHPGVELGVVPVAVVAARAGLGDVDRAVEQRRQDRRGRGPRRRPVRPEHVDLAASFGSLIAVK